MEEIDDKKKLEEITERVFQFMDAEGLSNANLADVLNVGPPTISHMKNGRSSISLSIYLKLLASFPNLNTDWLLNGKGNMCVAGKENATATPIMTSLFEEPRERNSVQKEIIEENVSQIQKQQTRQIKRIVVFYDDNSFQELIP